MMRIPLLLSLFVVPVALGAQALSSLTPDVRQYVVVPETSVALTNVRVVSLAVRRRFEEPARDL